MIKKVIAVISRGEARNYLIAKRQAEEELGLTRITGNPALLDFNQCNFAPVEYRKKEG